MRFAALAVALLFLLGTAATLGMSIITDEPGSALGEDGYLATESEERGLEVQRVVSSASRFGDVDPEETLAVILDADRPFSDGDVDSYGRFLRAGGNVLVVDGHGYGTQVAMVGGIAFERVRLLEPSASFEAVLSDRSVIALSSNATALRLLPDAGAEVLAWTTTSSFVDRDGNGRIDASDPAGPFPFLARVDVGAGRLWALSVPDVFVGDAASEVGNVEFRQALLQEASAGRTTLLVDESRVATPWSLPNAIGAGLRAGTIEWSQGVLGFAGLVGVLAVVLTAPAQTWRSHRFDPRRFLDAGRAEPNAAAGRPTRGWTASGLAATAVALALAVGAVVTGSSAAAWACAFLVGGLAAAHCMRAPHGTASRALSTRRLQESATMDVSITVRMHGGFAGADLREDLDSTVEVTSGSAVERATRRDLKISYQARPSRLGQLSLGPLEAQRRDGFRFRVARRELAPAEQVEVTPRLENARRAPFKSKIPQVLLGGNMVQRAGSGSEFLALRDYQVGDPMRTVNWKASARSKNLVVNQRVHESQTEITVFLDARAASDVGPAAATPFVLSCRAGASIAANAIRSRDRVRFILYGPGITEVAGRGMEQLRAVEDRLARFKAEGATTLRDALEPFLVKLKPGRPVIVITGAEADPTVLGALQMLRHRGARPSLLSPPVWARPGDGGEPQKSHDQLVKGARAAGIPVYEVAEGLRLDDLFRIQGVGA